VSGLLIMVFMWPGEGSHADRRAKWSTLFAVNSRRQSTSDRRDR